MATLLAWGGDGLESGSTLPGAGWRTVATYAAEAATSHVVPLTGVNQGDTIILAVLSAAVASVPAPWVTDDSQVSAWGGYVFRYDNAPAGLSSVTVTLSGSRALAVAGVASADAGALSYADVRTVSNTGSTLSSGAHTFDAGTQILAVIGLCDVSLFTDADLVSITDGYTEIVDSGFAFGGSNEHARVWLATGTAAMTASGITATFSESIPGAVDFMGFAVYETLPGNGDTVQDAIGGPVPTVDASGPRAPRIKFQQVSGGPGYLRWDHASDTTLAYRWYTRFSALAATSFTIAEGRSGADATMEWRLDIAGTGGSPAGELRLRNGANTQIADSGALGIPLETELRIEITLNADVLTCWVFEGEEITELFSVSGNVGASTSCTGIRIGNVLNTPTAPTFYVDDVQADDVAVRIGPAGGLAFPAYTLWDGVTELPLTLEGVWDGVAVSPLTFGQLT